MLEIDKVSKRIPQIIKNKQYNRRVFDEDLSLHGHTWLSFKESKTLLRGPRKYRLQSKTLDRA